MLISAWLTSDQPSDRCRREHRAANRAHPPDSQSLRGLLSADGRVEGVHKRGRGRPPLCRFFRGAFLDRAHDGPRHHLLGRLRQGIVHVLHQNGDRGVGRERRHAGEHFISHHGEAVNVAAMIGRFAKRLLWRHVLRRPGKKARTCHTRADFEHVGESKIADADSIRAVEEDVGRLDVSMDHAVRVRIVERACDGSQQAHDLAGVETAVFEERADRPTGEKSHAHPRDSIVDAAGIDRHDVRVLESGNDPGFPFEPLRESHVVQELGRQHFERDCTVEAAVARFVHRCHPASPEHPHNLKRTEHRSGRKGRERSFIVEG